MNPRSSRSIAKENSDWQKSLPWQPLDLFWASLLVLLLLSCCVLLWPEWLHNPDLSHGLATPLVFVILLREARRAPNVILNSAWSAGLIAAGCIGGLILFFAAALYAAALEWTHSLVECLLLLSAGLFVFSAALIASLPPLRRFSFNWPAVVAAAIWPLSAPIPPGTYTRLTQHLQASITDGVLFSLHLLGITAGRVGNVITLAHVDVGVEEACSGVRSLVSCFFAALFLSAVFCHRPWKRAVLIFASIPLALAMNFLRSLTLTLLANGGVEIEGFWHDATGYAILAVTALLLAGVARILEHLGARTAPTPPSDLPVSKRPIHASLVGLNRSVLAVSLALVLAIWSVFTIKTRSSTRQAETAIDLASFLPEKASGWTVSTRDDLYRFSSQLQTSQLFERTYARIDPHGASQVTVYLAFWPAGQASVSLVESHTPDACWPGSGWVEAQSAHRRLPLRIANRTLPAAEFRSFTLEGYPQSVWYWHLFDGAVIQSGGVNSPRELLSLAWHYGFRKDGQQVFVRVSSNRPWEEIAPEPFMTEIFQRLRKIGL